MREIDPTVFGPGTWEVTHVLALISEQSGQKRDYQFYSLFIYRMIHALPCAKCRRHAVRYLDRNPVPSTSGIFEWSVNFHNTVNQRLNKRLMPVAEARDLYENTEIVLQNKTTGATCKINGGGGCEDAPL